ncbi:MAG: NAD-binding protein [Candidatus Paceibacterota bacterium]
MFKIFLCVLILFFVFLGAQVGISELIVSLPTVLLFTIVLILIKFIVFFVIFVLFRFHSRSSFAIGVYLSQVGEFAFILLQSAVNAQLIESEVFSFAITVTLVSLIISPILIDKREAIYLIARRFIKRYVPSLEKYLHHVVDREPAHIEALDLKRHVIICGYGRVGKYIGRALSMAGVPYIAVDYNFQTVEEARKSGVRIIYGDPTDIDILDYLQAEHAFTLISAVPDSFSQERIILNAKMLKPDILIFSRVGRESEQRRMKDLGARVVVQPEFEAALSIVRRVFAGYKIPTDEARGKIKRLKIEHGML